MNLKPFDLEKALNGSKVFTRDEREVTQLTQLADSLVGVVQGKARLWRLDGKRLELSETQLDLFLAPEVVTGWVNVVKKNDVYVILGNSIFKTKENADTLGHPNAIKAQITFEI